MTIEALTTSFEFTEARIAGINADQWDNGTPCSEWNVRELVNHTIGAVFGMGSAAAGQAPNDEDAPDFSRDNPASSFRQAADAALRAWPDAADKMVNLGPVEVPGTVAMGVNLLDTLTHGWDIAIATDQSSQLPEAAAQAALEAARMILNDDLRGAAGFAAEVALADRSPSSTDALVAFLGRHPSGSALDGLVADEHHA